MIEGGGGIFPDRVFPFGNELPKLQTTKHPLMRMSLTQCPEVVRRACVNLCAWRKVSSRVGRAGSDPGGERDTTKAPVLLDNAPQLRGAAGACGRRAMGRNVAPLCQHGIFSPGACAVHTATSRGWHSGEACPEWLLRGH